MCIICNSNFEDLIGLKKINCHGCKIVRKIPNIIGLEILNCNDTNISEIPHIKGLKIIDCNECSIKEIPNIKGLKSNIAINA